MVHLKVSIFVGVLGAPPRDGSVYYLTGVIIAAVSSSPFLETSAFCYAGLMLIVGLKEGTSKQPPLAATSLGSA